MLIYVGEPHYKLITVQEGSGDNLDAQDIADGYVDYWMSSIYETRAFTEDGERVEPIDSGQILTSKLIADMEEEEVLKHIFEYWEVGDPEDRDTDYVVLERN